MKKVLFLTMIMFFNDLNATNLIRRDAVNNIDVDNEYTVSNKWGEYQHKVAIDGLVKNLYSQYFDRILFYYINMYGDSNLDSFIDQVIRVYGDDIYYHRKIINILKESGIFDTEGYRKYKELSLLKSEMLIWDGYTPEQEELRDLIINM